MVRLRARQLPPVDKGDMQRAQLTEIVDDRIERVWIDFSSLVVQQGFNHIEIGGREQGARNCGPQPIAYGNRHPVQFLSFFNDFDKGAVV